MSHSLTGEVSFTALGRNWSIRYDINVICRAEDRLGLGIGEIGQGLVNGRLGHVRTLLWAAMVEADPKLTELEVGRAMQEVGLAKSGELALGALRVAFPEVFGAPEGAAPADPPPAAA